MKALKVFIRPFEAPQRSVKKTLIFSSYGIGIGTGRVEMNFLFVITVKLIAVGEYRTLAFPLI